MLGWILCGRLGSHLRVRTVSAPSAQLDSLLPVPGGIIFPFGYSGAGTRGKTCNLVNTEMLDGPKNYVAPTSEGPPQEIHIHVPHQNLL